MTLKNVKLKCIVSVILCGLFVSCAEDSEYDEIPTGSSENRVERTGVRPRSSSSNPNEAAELDAHFRKLRQEAIDRRKAKQQQAKEDIEQQQARQERLDKLFEQQRNRR